MRCRAAILSGGFTCALVLSIVPSATAASTTVGQLFAPTGGCSGPQTLLQTEVASGTPYTVPAAGVITSWSFQTDASPVGGLKLKVGHNLSGITFAITEEAAAGTQTPNAVNTFASSVPVHAGDLIGIAYTGIGDCASATGNGADIIGFANADVAPGTNASFPPDPNLKIPVSAHVVFQPGVGSVSPATGPAQGGTHVRITGHDFTGATAVTFGGLLASSFTVESDGSINAIAPAASPGAADVVVTTAGGSSPAVAADRFTYAPNCVVPRLKGKTLRKARTLLAAAHCSFGIIAGPKHGKGTVVKLQSPSPGTLLADRGSVSVELGRKPKHKKRR